MTHYSVDWQPIETHPKDGTQFLVYGKWLPYLMLPGGTDFIDIAVWSTLQSRTDADHYLMIGLRNAADFNVNITHWAPLPLPPNG